MESKNTDKILKEFLEPLLQKPKPLHKNISSANNNNNCDKKENSGLRSNTSTYSILPAWEVTQGSVEIWANLPDEIRQDPALASFRKEHERIHGKKLLNFAVCFTIKYARCLIVQYSMRSALCAHILMRREKTLFECDGANYC